MDIDDQDVSHLKKMWFIFRSPFVVLMLTAPAWLPFLRTAALPCTHDNAFHYFRITAMRDALRHGWLFSRWVPNLALGYGYPFFNYREPLPYVLGEGLYASGVPLPLVLGLFYALSIFMAAYGNFILSRDLFGKRAAWVGAVAYALAPYVLLDAFRRGNLPESIALALLPWIFIYFRRLVIEGGKKAFITATALLTMLFITHNISALLLVPFLGLYVLTLTCLYSSNKKWPLAFLAVVLAVLLTAWFWLPALFEQDLVQLNLSHSTRNNDFHYNFISLKQILGQMPVPYDAQYLNPPMKVTLGVGQWALACIGILSAFVQRRTREQRAVIILMSIFIVGYLWMSTSSSVGVWEAIPLLSFVQFPWRLVGRALLPVSLLAASAFALPEGLKVQSSSFLNKQVPQPLVMLALSAVIFLLVVSAYPETYPPKGMCAVEPAPDIADVTSYELQGFLGMDPEQSYFPIWVEDHPSDTLLADAFAANSLPERLDTTAFPPNATAITVQNRILGATYQSHSPEGFRARWLGLYFPGWQVRVDGKLVPIFPEDDTGLITFDVPAGDHRINIRFGSTPLRTIGVILASAGLVGMGIFLWYMRLSYLGSGPGLVTRGWQLTDASVAVLALFLLLIKVGIVDRVATPVRQSRINPDRLPEVSTRIDQPFTDRITLLGYDISSFTLPGDGEIQVDLLWQANGRPGEEYATTVLVMGPDGQSWSPAGTLRPVGFETPPPTSIWEDGDYVYDPHMVAVLPGTPPGRYTLEVIIFNRQTLQPLAQVNKDGSVGASAYRLGTVQVTRPAAPFSLGVLGVAEDAEPQACGGFILWQMQLDREAAAPGDIVAVRWVWEKTTQRESGENSLDQLGDLSLIDQAGRLAHSWTLPLVAEWWPVSQWHDNETWIGRHVVRLPRALAGGEYMMTVNLPYCDEQLATSALNVSDIEREFNAPAEIVRVDAVFDGQVSLLGYDIPDKVYTPGDTVEVRLSWQAVQEIEVSYRIFLHLVDSESRVVDQHDGEPKDWTRPTTGWLVGEVVNETRKLVIPADSSNEIYSVHVGLYSAEGTRITLLSGDDHYTLPSIVVNQD